MNRTIKFRCWDGSSMDYSPRLSCVCAYDCYGLGCDLNDELENYELMQFTGLLDKAGTPIFEGDIVDYKDKENIDDSGVMTVGWDYKQAGWGRKYLDEDDFSATCTGEVLRLSKIIGNVFENPDLLTTNT